MTRTIQEPIETCICRHSKQGAATGLPLLRAKHAELSIAPAFHVIASFAQLDHCLAIVATLPAFLSSQLEDSLGGFVIFTLSRTMPFDATLLADFGLALLACSIPFAGDWIPSNVLWLDPYTAPLLGTVQPVLGVVLRELAVP
jgi:hypothetical protein